MAYGNFPSFGFFNIQNLDVAGIFLAHTEELRSTRIKYTIFMVLFLFLITHTFAANIYINNIVLLFYFL
jgi:hypothetical protein